MVLRHGNQANRDGKFFKREKSWNDCTPGDYVGDSPDYRKCGGRNFTYGLRRMWSDCNFYYVYALP